MHRDVRKTLDRALAPARTQARRASVQKKRQQEAASPLYKAAKDALRRCAREFTPARYVAATVALAACETSDDLIGRTDEEAFDAYSHIADDGEIRRLAVKIEAARAAWKAEDSGRVS